MSANATASGIATSSGVPQPRLPVSLVPYLETVGRLEPKEGANPNTGATSSPHVVNVQR
jgi:hypothetical protein